MPVIAMNQEMASLGKDVAEALAEELGLSLVTHEVVAHLAEKMHTRKSLLRRVLEGRAGVIDRLKTDSRSVSTFLAEEVFELAAQGNVVIRGWGATYLLRGIPHIPCVRICAPMDYRKRWLMERLDTDDESLVMEELRRSDAAHAHNMNMRFGVTWGDPLLYDLVLNTERLSVAACVAQIKALLADPIFAETEQSRRKLANTALEAHVKAGLKEAPATSNVDITVTANGGMVVLEGIVAEEEECDAAERVVLCQAGVTKVDNRLRSLSARRRDGE